MKIILNRAEIEQVLVKHLNKKLAPAGLRTCYQAFNLKDDRSIIYAEANIEEKETRKK